MTKSEKAVALFAKGYNCSQSVLTSFGQEFGLSEDDCLKISCAFGGGMGRRQLTCGAVTGALIVGGHSPLLATAAGVGAGLCAGVVTGFLSGMILGLRAEGEQWLGGYASLTRRYLRLAHVAFVALSIINILYGKELGTIDLPDHFKNIGSALMIFGAAGVPLACISAAFLKPLMQPR